MSETTTNPRIGRSGQRRASIVLSVGRMTCAHCASTVQGELAAVPGVVSADVDLDAGTAAVVGSAAIPALKAAVERAGCKVGGTESLLPDGAAADAAVEVAAT